MTRPHLERRRHPRVAPSDAVKARVSDRHEVLVLDLSFGGARLAHTEALRPRRTCSLHFTLKDIPIAVGARIVWSCLVGRTPDGVPLYQTGLAFQKVSSAVHASLAAFFKGYPLPVAMPASVEAAEAAAETPRAGRRPAAATPGEERTASPGGRRGRRRS